MTPLIAKYNSLNKILDAKERKRMCRDYMAWLKENHPGCDPHHVRIGGVNCGTGMRPHDLWCLPVTKAEHRLMQSYEISLDEQLEKLKKIHKRYMNEKGI